MADENELSGDAAAYFESRGEKIPEQKEKPSETEAPEEAEADETLLDDDKASDLEKVEKVVPLRALTREREEGKKDRAARQEAEKRAAILEDRWNTILALQAQQQEPEQPKKLTMADLGPEPDKGVDIFKWAEWTARRQSIQDDTIAELMQTKQQTEQQTQAAEGEKRVWSFWNESVNAEKAKNAEFADAVTWMAETRTKQLKTLANLHSVRQADGTRYYPFQTEAGINQQINAELRDIIIAAAQNNISPAEHVYNMAKEWGFQGKPADPNNNPEAKSVEKLAKDIESETSLSSAGGSRPGGGQTAKDIADMTPDQFETWLGKHGSAGFKRLMQRGNA